MAKSAELDQVIALVKSREVDESQGATEGRRRSFEKMVDDFTIDVPAQVQQGKRRGRDSGVGRGRGCVGQPCRPLFPRRRLHHRLSPDSPRHVGSPVTGFRGQGAGAGLPPRAGASIPRSGRGCGVIISLAAERGIRSRQDCLGGRLRRWRIDRGCPGSDTFTLA